MLDNKEFIVDDVDMYIAEVPNRNSPPAFLLRESYREGGKVKSRTLANLSKLPPEAIEALRRVLKGETLVPAHEVFSIVASYHHGHVEAVLLAMKKLGFARLLASRPSRERDLVQAMVVAQILRPDSKLAFTRWWHTTSLPSSLRVADASEDDLYNAMDWLLGHQGNIERRLAKRHLEDGALALYDLSSSYFEGTTCPLAALGHNRDGKKGKLQVNYGLLTDRRGCPVSVSVFKGNTGDPKTLLPQVERARTEFGLNRLVIVGDRGMITQKQIDVLRTVEGMEWITALRPEAIKKLVNGGAIQMGLFDERNLFELVHPDFPNERLVACRNPQLAKMRADKRASLIESTSQELEKVCRMVQQGRLQGREEIGSRVKAILKSYRIGKHYSVEVQDDGFEVSIDEDAITREEAESGHRSENRRAVHVRHRALIAARLEKLRNRIGRGRLHGKDVIGVRVGKVLNKYKVGKHFKLDIRDDRFDFEVDQKNVAEEAALDGLYVIRTGLPQQCMPTNDTVLSYKLLANVERAFRSFKTINLHVRPIRHRLENRVRAHILLCMLAYYVEWHMIEAWRPLLFADEDQDAKRHRDPVAPARRSPSADQKASSKMLEDGTTVHSLATILTSLSTIVRNVCQAPGTPPDSTNFDVVTTPNRQQQRALDLIQSITL